MTYKQIRKIKVYILIIIIIFILLNNFQLILNTRNIFQNTLENRKIALFLQKNTKKEEKPNIKLVPQEFLAEKEQFFKNILKYKEKNRTISTSRVLSLFDKFFFIVKRLINHCFVLLKICLVSVKSWYFDFENCVFTFRKAFLWLLEEAIFPRGRPLAKGMLLGDTSSISQELYHSFKVIGILHLLSASSSNLNLFLSFFKPFFLIFSHFFLRKTMFFFYLSVIFIYFSLVGEAASMLRAVFLLFLAYLAKYYLKRAFLPTYLLLMVGILMLLINPFYLSSLGFQLSFLACFGIYYLFPKLKKTKNTVLNFLLNNLLITISAQFFLLIVFVTTFEELNYIGIIANLFISPLVDLLTTGFLCLVILSFGVNIFGNFSALIFFKSFLSYLLSKIVDIFEKILYLINKIPYKTIIIYDNKSLFIAIILLINFLTIFSLEVLKKKSLKKEKYRILK